MKPQIPSFGPLRRAPIGAASALCAALLPLGACAGSDGDETQLAPDPALAGDETIGSTRQALWGNDCKDVFITVYNYLDLPIEVTKVEYDDQTDSTWRTEGLADKVVWPDSYEHWTENLEHSSGDRIGDFKIHYEDYYGTFTHYDSESTVTCVDNKSFVLEVD